MKSIWSLNIKLPKFKSLDSDIKTNVCVIGGGITGILTTYFLNKQGIDCVLIESKTIASGVTANTSAKVTCQHDLIYDNIINQSGLEKAQQYATANLNALTMYQDIIKNENIKCAFEKIPTYLYTKKNITLLENELEAVKSLGFESSLTNNTTLPFKVTAALKMENQAQFNPLTFLSSVSSNLPIYEQTKAINIKDNTIITNKGEITADQIIVTTHFPFINTPGFYFAKMHQERSYVTALKNTGNLDGAYLGIDNNDNYSFRSYKDMVLVGGFGHRTGENTNGSNYKDLTKKALEFYPNSKQVCSWSTQDCMTNDGIPYIGKYSSTTDNLYVATGFNKWGMTSSMVSAMILSDIIQGKENDCAEVFNPQRSILTSSAKKLATNGIKAMSGLIKQNLIVPSSTLSDIKTGHGKIIEYKGEKLGVYKKTEDDIYIVSTKCPHLGCELAWNQDDLSWDCPCHGSRFDYKGNILNNPSLKGLNHEKS